MGKLGNAHVPRTRLIELARIIGLGELSAEHLAVKMQTANRRFNQSSGHKIGVQRDKRRFRSRQRKGGGGFSYKPEIAYVQAGSGECLSAYLGREEYGWGVVSLRDLSGENEMLDREEDSLFRQRYERKDSNHPAQSMPKVEWAAVRNRRNRRIPTINTTQQSLWYKRIIIEAREADAKNHRFVSGRGRC